MNHTSLNDTAPGPNGDPVQCDPNIIRANYPIPDSVSYFVGSTTLDDPGMRACCGTNALNLIDNCYVWCSIPEEYLGNRTNRIPEEDVGRAFRDCMTRNNGTVKSSAIHLSKFHSPEGSAPVRTPGLGKVLLMAGVMYLVLL